MVYCSKCGTGTEDTASFCSKCGASLAGGANPNSPVTVIVNGTNANPILAGILSFLIPGLGQVYNGQFIEAVVWFFMTGLGYLFFVLPGLILHICSIIAAYRSNQRKYGIL